MHLREAGVFCGLRGVHISCNRHQTISLGPRDRTAIAKVFAEIPRKKLDFAHGSDVVARVGGRELRAVNIRAFYDAWRPPKRRKTIQKKSDCFWSRKLILN